MASQITTAAELQVLNSNIRGYHAYKDIWIIRDYHAYKDIWILTVGETLLLNPEPTNAIHKKAVAVLKDSLIVGHVPHNLAPQDSSSF